MPTKVINSIRALRFAHGEMTQAELADCIGVTRQTIIAIEQGRYSPSPEMAFQITREVKTKYQPLSTRPPSGGRLSLTWAHSSDPTTPSGVASLHRTRTAVTSEPWRRPLGRPLVASTVSVA